MRGGKNQGVGVRRRTLRVRRGRPLRRSRRTARFHLGHGQLAWDGSAPGLPLTNPGASHATPLRCLLHVRCSRLLDVLKNLQSSARRRRLRSRPWSAVAATSPSTRCATTRLPFGPRGSPRIPNEPYRTRSMGRSLLSGPRSDRVHKTGVSLAEVIGQPPPKIHTARPMPTADGREDCWSPLEAPAS